MMAVDKSRIISLADKVFSIFLSLQCTEMQMMTFITNWQQSFGNQKMNKSVLSTLPFLKIIEYDLEDDDDSDSDDYSSSISIDPDAHEIKPEKQETSPLIIINIEQDDCCNFCKLGKKCKLIHVLSRDHYCSEFEKSGHCSNFQCKLFHRPNIKLIQRLIDCFKSKNVSSLKLNELITLHNELYPQFISHSPTPFGITARCSSKFECKSDAESSNSNDFVIDWKGLYTNPNLAKFNIQNRISPSHHNRNSHQYQPWNDYQSPRSIDSNSSSFNSRKKSPIIPEQSDMFKIYMKLEKQWVDNALIKELLQHFKKHSKFPLKDMYIPRRNRSGFVTFKYKAEAAKFMAIVNSPNPSMKCGGRTISVRKPTKQNINGDNGIKLQVINIGTCVSFPQFVAWCRENIDTPDIYNLQLVNNTVTEGAGYAILVIQNEKDGKQFIRDLDGRKFRGENLTYSPWIEPVEYKKNLAKLNKSEKHSNSWFKNRRYSTPTNVNHKSNSEYIWEYGSPSARTRRHSMPPTNTINEVTEMMSQVDIDFEQRKTMSRLKKRHSLSSDRTLTSNSEFPSKLKHSPQKTITESTDIPANIGFKEWLSDIAKCGEYYDMFINAGFESMDEMDPSLVTHEVLKEVGVDKIGHRVKILKAIDQFRNAVGVNN